MCNLSDGVANTAMQRGLAQGASDSLCRSITNLMRNLNLTMEQAMKALGIDEKE